MKKRVWLTMLEKDEDRAKRLFQNITKYGLAADGHFWADDLDKMAWAAPLETLSAKDVGVWVIAGKPESFAAPETRYGLAGLALAAEGARGGALPILLLPEGKLDPATLPTPLAGAEVVAEAGLGPKLAAKANLPLKPLEQEYRATVHPLAGLGQWFEVGPGAGHTWDGVMLGVDTGSGAEIAAHGVGPAGAVPEKAVLEYPMQGLTLDAGGAEFTAWAVKNALTENDSYYALVKGAPEFLLFGSFSETEEAELYRLAMK